MDYYGRFAAMIATSTIIMLGFVNLNTYEVSHALFSQTRGFMPLVMGATMAVIMLGFMLGSQLARHAQPSQRVGSLGVSSRILSSKT